MTVSVRLFAALREAAGTSLLDVDAADLGTLLDDLRARFGEPFTERLARSKIVVDGVDLELPADATALADGAEVVLLPPFSGG